MNAHTIRLTALVTLAAGSLALGCKNDPPTAVTPGPGGSQPLVVASGMPTAAPQQSITPASSAQPEASPTPVPSPSVDPLLFRDDFTDINGQPDATRWAVFPGSGIVRELDGTLELLSAGQTLDYPYLLTKEPIIPAKGPWFYETRFKMLSQGTQVTFSLDYLPPPAPNKPALTQPFMTTGWFYRDVRMNFALEDGSHHFDGPEGNVPGGFHRIRVESDNSGVYRVIWDNTEIGTFMTAYRPTKFWIGTPGAKPAGIPVTYPRLAIDYVTAGPLTTADPAKPKPTKSP